MKENYIEKALLEKNFDILREIFDEKQMKTIHLGLNHGLSQEEMMVFVNPDFNHGQMAEICRGFRQGLTSEQVLVYAKLEFQWNQMCQIRFGLEQGLSIDEVMEYAKPEVSHKDMDKKRKLLVSKGLTEKQMAEKIFRENSLSYLQKREILAGLKDGLSVEQMKVIANPEFHYTHMKWLRKNTSPYQGMSNRFLKLCLQPGFINNQLEELRFGLIDGLTLEEIASYADPKLSAEKMKVIREDWVKSKTIE